MDGNQNPLTVLSMVDGMINGVVIFNFDSARFDWQRRRRRHRAGENGGGDAAAATSKNGDSNSNSDDGSVGFALRQKRDWTCNGKTATTVKVTATATVPARFLLGVNGDAVAKMSAASLEWQRQNGGDGQGGGNSNSGGTGFAWQW